MNEVLTPDICVIGAGSAGLTLAAAAASLGVSVVLIEKGMMGGECQNTGCVPSKALIAAALQLQAIRAAPRFGVAVEEPRVNFSAVMEHVRGVVAAIAPNDSAERFTGLGVTVLRGEAKFVESGTVAVEEARVHARRFVIATGSRPAVPDIPGLATVPFLTNETVFSLRRLPARLAVIGGGASGLELAQAFRRLGSEVTVLEADRALAGDDPELAALLLESLRTEGIDIRESTRIVRVARRGRTAVRLTLGREDGETLDASHLLVCAGRRPAVESLGLKEARIAFEARGIRVNSRFRTKNRRVYAIGDVVAGGPRFTHWGSHQAGLVLRTILFRFGGKARPDILPWTTFTEPALAHVGLGEAEARRRHGRISILRWPFSENDRAVTERATQGLVKLVVTRRGRVVGADVLAPEAGELLAPLIMAVAEGIDVKSLASAVFPYPTRSDALRRAALSYYAERRDSPWLRRFIHLMRKFG